MTAVTPHTSREQATVRRRFTPALSRTPAWSLIAAALLLGSALLQLVASLQRWVEFRNSWTREDRYVEDHLFDYSYPSDPWENLGSTAQFFGAGYVLLALGVMAMMRAVAMRSSVRTVAGSVSAWTLASVVALAFGIDGAHALVSGILGIPTFVQYFLFLTSLLGIASSVCLLVLAVLWARTAWASSLACLLLMGATIPGYLVAAFVIAPEVAGYQSYDSTPWTETIVAAWPAAAAVALLVGAGVRAAIAAGRGRAIRESLEG